MCVQCWDLLLLCFLVQVISCVCIKGFSAPTDATAKTLSNTLHPTKAEDGRGRRKSGHREQQQQQESAGEDRREGFAWLLPVAFNRNMLSVFLLANVLTGLINQSINTLGIGDWQGRSIVGKGVGYGR